MTAALLIGLAAAAFPVTIRVDAGRPQGELAPIWGFFGSDELSECVSHWTEASANSSIAKPRSGRVAAEGRAVLDEGGLTVLQYFVSNPGHPERFQRKAQAIAALSR